MIETLGIEKGRLKTVYIKVVIFISDTQSDETCVCLCLYTTRRQSIAYEGEYARER